MSPLGFLFQLGIRGKNFIFIRCQGLEDGLAPLLVLFLTFFFENGEWFFEHFQLLGQFIFFFIAALNKIILYGLDKPHSFFEGVQNSIEVVVELLLIIIAQVIVYYVVMSLDLCLRPVSALDGETADNLV